MVLKANLRVGFAKSMPARNRPRRFPTRTRGPWSITTLDTVLCLPRSTKHWQNGRARKKHRESLPARSFGSLPLDIQMQILSWLPAEDAMRLRAVCKGWALMLRDPEFLQMWAEQGRCRAAVSLFLLHRWRKPPNPTLYFKFSYPVPAPEGLFRFRKCLPENSYAILSAGGLVVCINENWTWVGNPLTQQWVKVPPLEISEFSTRRMLVPYVSEGRMFFRLWVEPYLFDSKVGIWMLPRYETISMWSCNTVCVGGVCYGLGRFWEADTVVLLEIEDLLTVSESRWLYAWDKQTTLKDIAPNSAYMLEVNGEVGMLAQQGYRLVVFVLDRQNGWSWKKVSTLPSDIEAIDCFCTTECCTYGKLTFVCVEEGVAIFDSESLTWTWFESPPRVGIMARVHLVVWELNAAAVPHLNTPSEELRRTCASRYHDGDFRKRFRLRPFSDLEALRKRGMSWQEIGRVMAADPSKGGEFVAKVIQDGTEKNNFGLKPGFDGHAGFLRPE